MKNKILAVLGGTISLFGLGYLIYMILFGDATFNRGPGVGIDGVLGEFNVATIILMEVLYAVMMTIVFSKWTQIRSFSEGAMAGLVLGLFIGVWSNLELFSTTTLTNVNGVLFAGVTFAIRFAVAGGVIGIFLGKEE